jgi:protease YdgD
MTSKIAPMKFLSLLITGFLVIVLLRGFASALSQESTVQLAPIAPNFATFDLSTNLEPFIPPNLEQSNNPNEGGRGVIGRDDRVSVTSRSYPWSAIGRIEYQDANGENYICTGTLVKSDIVLTNAHCVVDPETQTAYQNLQFAPNLIDGKLQAESDRTTAIEAWLGTDFSDRNEHPHPDDWAFLKLEQPLGETYGTIGWRSLPLSVLIENPEQFIMVGYSGDFPTDNPGATAGVHEGCSILGSLEDDVLRHNCDTFGGSSGGPILGILDDQYWIMAINSSERIEQTSGRGIVNFATKISRIIERIEAVVESSE